MSGDGGSNRSPDVLLSFAKDGRYVAEVEKLLSDFAVSLASVFWGGGSSSARTARRGATATANDESDMIFEEDGQRFADRIRPELNLIASLVVHTAPLIYFTRRFGDDTPSSRRFRTGAQRSVGMEALNLRYHFPNDRVDAENVSVFRRIRHGTVRALQLGTNRWQRLLLLQTIFPYVMNRVGRGGWSEDLGSAARCLSRFIGTRECTRRLPDESRRSGNLNEGGDISAENDELILNDDRLRGSARRRLFHEQRRRMASSVDSAGSDAPSSTRGNDNRSVEVTEGAQDQRLRLSRLCWKWARVSANLFMFGSMLFYGQFPTLFAKRVSQAMSSLCHGAHTLANHGVSNSESLDRWSKTLKWLLRLHLALFYWNGVYPSISHRLVGAKIKQDLSPYNGQSVVHSAEIVANRPSLKPIAVMILAQAASVMIRASCELSVELLHYLQLLHLKWKRKQEQIHLSINSGLAGRYEYMNLVEQCVPSIDSFADGAAEGKNNNKSRKKTGRVHQCGICLSEHVNPAVPTNCGHVFCWNCIQHWVSNVKNECPLCRAKTKPQDILPLCNYFT